MHFTHGSQSSVRLYINVCALPQTLQSNFIMVLELYPLCPLNQLLTKFSAGQINLKRHVPFLCDDLGQRMFFFSFCSINPAI